ncbi:iron(III) transport system permease protein [Trinickia symbiotica]|uniref:ABC transporter permease n=1 Tax=Trinickia symbiotica TaxID=863227 RepID=A0A2N7X575_9BURK|nr:iron ABC transporter permease [Trinickia symbiotica]PMS36774.1 ABC transporter permease [Trinickia symbiotica]PPK46222.1 iron(III) transport system permease protein [Trinickia symbiotica]
MTGSRAARAAGSTRMGDRAFLLPVFAVAALTVAPTARLVWEALSPRQWSTHPSGLDVLTEPSTWQALSHSVYTCALGTIVGLLLGGFIAFALTLTDLRAKGIFAFCFVLPMMIPPQVTALAWLQLTGPASPLLKTLGLAPPLGSPQPLYSAGGIALLLGIQYAPMVFLSLRASLVALPADLIEAALLAGASRVRVWRDIVVPLVRPGLLAAAALVFVSALGNFGIPALLGIPASYYVLPTLIYQKMVSFGNATLPQVAVLSLLIGAVALAGIGLQSRLLARPAHRLSGQSARVMLRLGRARGVVEAVMALILAAILFAPLLALVASSLVPAIGVALNPHTLTLQAYGEMLGRQGVTLRALRNSTTLAVTAAVLLPLLIVPVAWQLVRRPGRLGAWLAAAIEIPYAVPGVVLAIACILLFARPLPFIEISLYGSLIIILLAYLARFMVVALKPVQTSIAQLDLSLEEAARLAGANHRRSLGDIVLPLVAPSALAGAVLVFLMAFSELTVSALLWSAGNETLGVLIFNLNESGENALAAAVAVAIVLLVGTLMGLLGLFSHRLPKGVIPWRT